MASPVSAAPTAAMTCECGFHNLPGARACLRCRKALVPAKERAEPEEVTPPRARGWAKRGRRLGQLVSRVEHWLDAAAARRRKRKAAGVLPARIWRLSTVKILQAIVPGQPLRADRRHLLGWQITAAWAVLMGIFLVSRGSDLGWWMLSFAIGVHVFSACWAWRQELAFLSLLPRLGWSLVIWLALFCGLYYPGTQLIEAASPTMQIQAKIPGLAERGDIMTVAPLDDPTWPPPHGTLVVVTFGGGAVLDRVLGHPGDTIEWDRRRQQLLRNGEPVPREQWPLRPNKFGKRAKLTVPADHICVVPTATMGVAVPEVTNLNAGNFVFFRQASLMGRPDTVRWPLSRRKTIGDAQATGGAR